MSTPIPHDVEPSEGAEADEALAAHKAALLRWHQLREEETEKVFAAAGFTRPTPAFDALADGIRNALRCAGFNADVFAEDLPGRVRDTLTHMAERAQENQDAYVATRTAARAEAAEARVADVEALLTRLGCPGIDDATLAERVAAVINWCRKIRSGEWSAAEAMSYGIDADALAAHDAAAVARARVAEVEAELRRLESLINTPRTADWLEAVRLEAAHQIERWGTSHDDGKAPADWFWLLGYLGGKALTAQLAGNTEKALHHTISTGAALLNWHRAITAIATRRQDTPEERS